MQKISRRKFLKQTSLAASLATIQILPSRLLGRGGIAPSGRVNFGIIGNGCISFIHRRFYSKHPLSQVIAVCDVHKGRLENAKNEVERITKERTDVGFKPVDTYKYYQELIARNDIDAVVVTTPDHWHVAIALYAIQKGKAVFVEKPMSLTIEEGRILADAVAKKRGILQVGTQQRSERAFRRAAELVLNGYIGNVKQIDTQIGVFPEPPKDIMVEHPIPEGFDYDLWLGQTPYYPYHPFRVLGAWDRGWRCFYDYGQLKDGDWGAHHFDIIQWALGMDNSGPTDFYPENSDGSPYRHFRYANGTTVYVNAPVPNKHMIRFIGDEGEIFVSRNDRLDTTSSVLKNMPLKSSDKRLVVSNNHYLDFLNAIVKGTPNVSPAEIGHRSATVCQLLSIARRTKSHVKWNPETEKVINNPKAEAMLSRPRRAPYFLGA